jgi:drug/metabolite transporter (DMT)-like permease
MSAALLYGLVILSAIAHAAWNALVKSAGDRMLTMVAIRTTGMMLGLIALPFVDWPAPESWKWLALTSVVMFAYYALLVRSYGVGDMSVVYPLARGLAPVLTTIAAFVAIGEALSTGQVVAVAMISLGIMALSFGAGASRAAVGFALATGVCVATYSFFAGWACALPGRCWASRPAWRSSPGSARAAMALSCGAPISRSTSAATGRSGFLPAWWGRRASWPSWSRPQACRSAR